jgi:glycosyltransferase involved in cell wall biosynthesis
MIPKLEIFIIGDGPERDRLKSQLTKLSPSLKVNFKGHLVSSELQRMWDHVDMLFSLAPFESYGRTIREALVSGTPVLAQSSSGVRDLHEALSSKWLQLISEPITEKELIDQVYFMKKVQIPEKFRKALASECGKGNFDLVGRWINIAEISEPSKGAN